MQWFQWCHYTVCTNQVGLEQFHNLLFLEQCISEARCYSTVLPWQQGNNNCVQQFQLITNSDVINLSDPNFLPPRLRFPITILVMPNFSPHCTSWNSVFEDLFCQHGVLEWGEELLCDCVIFKEVSGSPVHIQYLSCQWCSRREHGFQLQVWQTFHTCTHDQFATTHTHTHNTLACYYQNTCTTIHVHTVHWALAFGCELSHHLLPTTLLLDG